jgi:[protein-PII] uridylyltransferase
MLLRTLYRQTSEALEHGLEEVNREMRSTEAKRSLRQILKEAGWATADIRTEVERHYPPYWQGVQPATHAVFARLLKGLREDEIRIDLTPDPDRDATRACFALADHPGIFARVTGALALWGPTWWTRAPTPARTASRPPCSGFRMATAPPTRSVACPACAA